MKQNCRLFFTILLINFILLFLSSVYAQNISRQEYFEKYTNIAKQKMREYRIPASITLAQGLLESGGGNSRLAREANNHFGIKCHREWTGATFLYDDDVKNECFRKYASAEESYNDHSLFLTLRPRYAELFKLDILDYAGWAHGLKQAGYATNPNYAQHLIRVIEENQLFLIDQAVVNEQTGITEEVIHQMEETYVAQTHREFKKIGDGPNHRTLYLNNKKLFVFARANDTWFSIANDFDIKLTRLMKFNDADYFQHPLIEGGLVYIQCKKARSTEKNHQVRQGETLHTISQLYGIRLRSLARINGIDVLVQVKAGDLIKLR